MPDAGYTWTWIAQYRDTSDSKKITVHGNGNSPGECAVALCARAQAAGLRVRWDGSPFSGERWKRGREVRTVHDRALDGDVLWYTGDRRRRNHQCTWNEWQQWVTKATRVA